MKNFVIFSSLLLVLYATFSSWTIYMLLLAQGRVILGHLYCHVLRHLIYSFLE